MQIDNDKLIIYLNKYNNVFYSYDLLENQVAIRLNLFNNINELSSEFTNINYIYVKNHYITYYMKKLVENKINVNINGKIHFIYLYYCLSLYIVK